MWSVMYLTLRCKLIKYAKKIPWFLCARTSIINIAHITKTLFCIFDKFAPQKPIHHLLQILQNNEKVKNRGYGNNKKLSATRLAKSFNMISI